MFRISIVIFTCTLYTHTLSAQAYDYSWKEHKKHFIGSSVFFAAAQIFATCTDYERVDDLADIDTRKLWRIDIGAVQQQWDKADQLSDFTLYSSLAFPMLINLGNKENKGSGLSIAAMGLQGLLVENGLNVFVKNIAERTRPYIIVMKVLS